MISTPNQKLAASIVTILAVFALNAMLPAHGAALSRQQCKRLFDAGLVAQGSYCADLLNPLNGMRDDPAPRIGASDMAKLERLKSELDATGCRVDVVQTAYQISKGRYTREVERLSRQVCEAQLERQRGEGYEAPARREVDRYAPRFDRNERGVVPRHLLGMGE